MEREGFTALDLLVSIHGPGKHGAEELGAEIGLDMSVSPTPQALASWVGLAPGSHESAGRQHPVAARPGNRYAKRALGIAAKSAARMRNSFLAAPVQPRSADALSGVTVSTIQSPPTAATARPPSRKTSRTSASATSPSPAKAKPARPAARSSTGEPSK